MALWRSTWPPALSGLRLWQRLAIVLMPLLVLVTALELWMTRHDALEAANAAYDRSLVAGIGPLQAYTTRLADNLSLMVAVIVVLFWNFFANRHWTYNDVE